MKTWICSLFSILPFFLQAEDSPLWQSAASLYQSGDYEGAYQEADKLLVDHPNDPVLLRLQGMALLDAGHPQEAVRHLRGAVALHPTSVAMAFYLAQAYAAAGHLADARDLAYEIIQFAPDSEYAARCRQGLAQLEAMLADQGVSTRADQRFDVYLRVGADFDDNVIARATNDPEPGPTDTVRFTSSLWLNWRVIDQEADEMPLSASVSFSGYRSWHDRDQFQFFDLQTEGVSLSLSRSMSLAGRPLYLSLDGGGSQTALDGEDYSQVSTLGLSGSWWLSSFLMMSVNGQNAWKDFEGSSEYPEYFDRDGEDWSAGVSVDSYFAGGKVVLGLNYDYRNSDAEGSQFRFDSHNGGAQVHLQLPLDLRMSLGLAYQQSDYTDFLPQPTRIDDVWTYNATLVKPFRDQTLNAELGFTHIDADSSIGFATYEQNIISLAVSLNL